MSSKWKRRWARSAIPKPIQEAFAVHEALRRLGFMSQDIYFLVVGPLKPGYWASEIAPDGRQLFAILTPAQRFQIMVLLRRGEEEFRVTTGFLGPDYTKNKISKIWREFSDRINSGNAPQDELERIWKESELLSKGEELLTRLHERGFVSPGDFAEPEGVTS